MYNSLSIVIGTLIAVMILFNGAMSKVLGNGISLILIHLTGLVTVLMVLFFRGQLFRPSKDHGGMKQIPWVLYTAGALGVVTVVFNNVSFLNIGMSLTLALGLLGQSITSVAIDHFGFMEMPKTKFKRKKIFGLVLIIAGIIVMTIW